MKRETIQKTLIYKEFGEDKAKNWFLYTRDKFISHVDTFYYSVKTVGDWHINLYSRALVGDLKQARTEADKTHEPQPFMQDDVFNDLVIKPFFGFKMYKYGITKEDCFDIFIADSVPNMATNAIFVQLRSQFIWLNGLKNAFYESFVYVSSILDRYGIQIRDVTENRIDFAYHTNYIQNMFAFFSDNHLGKMFISNYERGGKEFRIHGDDLETDYISIGRRKSNRSFVRIYNKSKEVIEMGYKQFFVPVWSENGLISEFDKYIFEKVFEEGKQSWNYKEVARCKFYLEHGSDVAIKEKIQDLMNSINASAEDFKKLADSVVPDLTDVVNIEIQTKREFYYDFIFPKIEYPAIKDKDLVFLKNCKQSDGSWVPVYERRIYKILHMLQSIRDFITTDTIRFVKYKGEFGKMRRERRPTADWWKRLASCGELDGISYQLCKDYQCKYDVYRSKRRMISDMSSFVTMLEYWRRSDTDDNFSFKDDVMDSLCYLNDNDLAKYSELRARKRKELSAKFGKLPVPEPEQPESDNEDFQEVFGGVFD